MTLLLSNQSRLLILIVCGAVLWFLELIIPLDRNQKDRVRRATPNLGLSLLLVLTNLSLSFAIVGVANITTSRGIGLFFFLSIPSWLLCLFGVIALDLFTYFAHVLMHKSWLGWQFHRVHHSDNEVNVTTAFRQHPGETIWRSLWYVSAIIVFGLPAWVFFAYLLIATLNAQLEHTNIKLGAGPDRALRLLFVTPNLHKIHHSRNPVETDTNYSNTFSIWDRIFRTYRSSIDLERLRYGLDGYDDRQQTFSVLLKLPFKNEH